MDLRRGMTALMVLGTGDSWDLFTLDLGMYLEETSQ
jgi:hypothetical protein